MPHTTIRRLALASATGGILALTGCAAVTTNGPSSVVQPTPLSDTVTVSQAFCADAPSNPSTLRAVPASDPGCPAFAGYYSTRFTSGGGGRLLVAVQVADGTPDPTLTLRRRHGVAFAKDADVLAKVDPAPAGSHWVGYRSDEVDFALGEANAGDVVDVDLAIPRTGTRPASDELSTPIAIGDQVTGNGFGSDFPADRAVDCDEDLSDAPHYNSDVSTTTCPEQDEANNVASSASTSDIVPTDAQVTTPGQEVAVVAGSTVTVPFSVAQTGQAPEASELTLSAATSVPGGQAAPSIASVPWDAPVVPDPPTTTTTTDATTTTADAAATRASDATARAADPSARTTDVPVTVTVPADAAAGLYDVTLNGSDAGGSRAATAHVRVTAAAAPAAPAQTPAAPAPPAPAAFIKLGKAASAGKGKALAVAATISGPGTIEAVATHTLPHARATSRATNTLTAGPHRLIYARLVPTTTSKTGKVALVLVRTAAGRRAKYAFKTITLHVVVQYTPTGGKAIRVTKNVRVKIAG